MKVEVGKIYKHFKGDCVSVLCLAKHSETEEEMVVYEHLDTKEIWARPYSMFVSLVDKEKYPEVEQEYRFEPIDGDL